MRKLTDDDIRNYFGQINPIDHPEYFSGRINNFMTKKRKKEILNQNKNEE